MRWEKRNEIEFPNIWERSPSPPAAFLRRNENVREVKFFFLIQSNKYYKGRK
jgi:hypothetical protein